MAVVRQQITADELLHMPDDGFRYELVEGELRQNESCRLTPLGKHYLRMANQVRL